MKINLTLIAVGTAILAAPAGAQSGSATQSRGGTASEAAQERKYCLQYEAMTGSRITKQACKTKGEWAKEDVDIDALLKRN